MSADAEGVKAALIWMMNQPEISGGGQTAGRIHHFLRRCARAWGFDLEKAVLDHIKEQAK